MTSAVLFAACGAGAPSVDENRADSARINNAPEVASAAKDTDEGPECRVCDFEFAAYEGELSKKEIDALLLALNDEYKAWATYDEVNKQFSEPRPFVNIQRAESRHIDRLKAVYLKYGVRIPENEWIGEAPRFRSIAEACEFGAAAEIANRDLYDKLLDSTKRDDILLVYKALQSASERNHLPAFERCSGNGTSTSRGQDGRNR